MGIEDVCNGQLATDKYEKEVIARQTEDGVELEYSLGMTEQQV